jgi:ABC-type lipopolysaccharide export system ATPase subunit
MQTGNIRSSGDASVMAKDESIRKAYLGED